MIKVEDNKLFFSNNHQISFTYPIGDFISFTNTIVVRLELPRGNILNENIYGVAHNGNIIWQIPKIPHVYPDSPYMSLKKIDEQHASSHNWDGDDIIFDINTGEITHKSYSK